VLGVGVVLGSILYLARRRLARQHASITLRVVPSYLGVRALWPRRAEFVTFSDRSDSDVERNARSRPIHRGSIEQNALTLKTYLATIVVR